MRTVDLAGRGIAGFAAGTPFAAYGLRQVYPAGLRQDGYGRPLIGYSRSIAPAGFAAGYWGQANVRDNTQRLYVQGIASQVFGVSAVEHNPRILRPVGLASGIAWGRAEAWNLRQIVRPFAEPGDWGERFGTFNYVENRNRTITTYGQRDSRFGLALVALGGRAVLPAGFEATAWGRPLVAYAIRALPVPGIEPGGMGGWTGVRNAARVIGAVGTVATAFGAATVANTRRTLQGIGGIEGFAAGTPFVADRVRRIEQYRFPDPPWGGQPTVELGRRYLDLHDRGVAAGGVGRPDARSHRNVIAPRWNYTGKVGSPALRNLTPEIGAYGHDSAAFGRAAVRNGFEVYRLQGFEASLMGRPVVERRTRVVAPAGIRAIAFGRATCLWGNPELPYPRTLAPASIESTLLFGQARVHGNVLYAEGFVATRFGMATVRANSVYPPSLFDPDQFGVPSLNVTQWLTPDGIEPPGHGKPGLSPLTVWAPYGAPERAIANHDNVRGQRIDAAGAVGGAGQDDGARPFFGKATVRRVGPQPVAPLGLAAGALGDGAWISLRRRTLPVAGLKSQKFGYPTVGAGGVVETYGADSLQMGTPGLAHYVDPHAPRTLLLVGIAPAGFGTTDVQNQHRTLLVPGLYAFRAGMAEVGPPKRADDAGGGDMALYGTPAVSLKMRFLQAAGWDSAVVAEYSAGDFPLRMRVSYTGNVTVTPDGLPPAGGFGYPGVVNAQQVIRQIGCCSSGLRMGRPQAASA